MKPGDFQRMSLALNNHLNMIQKLPTENSDHNKIILEQYAQEVDREGLNALTLSILTNGRSTLQVSSKILSKLSRHNVGKYQYQTYGKSSGANNTRYQNSSGNSSRNYSSQNRSYHYDGRNLADAICFKCRKKGHLASTCKWQIGLKTLPPGSYCPDWNKGNYCDRSNNCTKVHRCNLCDSRDHNAQTHHRFNATKNA